jgi:hypothetical protein
MSLRVRRTLSWLGTAAVIAVLASAVRRLPGSGGLYEELHWLLSRAPTTRTLNQAFGLTLLAEQQRLGSTWAAWARLLRDDDPQVVQNALTVLGDKLRSDPQCRRPEMADVRDVVQDWLRQTPDSNVPPSSAAVFDKMFEPDWRRKFESSSGTRPGGDGHRGE